MSLITATNSSATNALASLLKNTATTATTDTSTPAKATTSDPTASQVSRDPVDTVDLSDRAKATLARARTEQVAADKLTAQVAATKNLEGKGKATKVTSDGGSQLFDRLTGRAKPQQAGETKWEAGSKSGDASISDAEFTAKYKDAFLGALEGLPPEKREALQTAIDTGTLKFQQGSEVSGYNTRTTISYSTGPGGGQGMSTSGYSAPTGATKEAIEAGNAVSLWTEDRGDVYVTW
jgi:hypothetical protein